MFPCIFRLKAKKIFNGFVGILSTFPQILLVILEKIALFFSAISSVAAPISFYNKRITVLLSSVCIMNFLDKKLFLPLFVFLFLSE